ncbi:unnamed protein product [Rhizoctonia solani]|uniref:Uncharacterized protein n=1 Tax=Rhizoctonia solani TaxID=456999 RepID=A0A8H2XIX0_9AGAM|nr:unnamed protein product [Rhizoctonia solani]
MEVMDSHMSEHFSAQVPTHIDIDMSPEYDDDAEYAMHDLTEATATTNDEEIYDAEFEEVPDQTEIEMDEYADEVEVVDDNESHMGTYVPTDDAATVTDVTVEDVQLRSSPVPEGTPQGVTMRPISPHVPVTAGVLNEVPADTLVQHSPHSVATLVDDSELEHLPVDNAKDGALNEVIDLTGGEEEPQIVSVAAVEEVTSVEPVEPTDQEVPQSEHEVPQVNHDIVEQDLYDTEEPVIEIPSTTSTISNQLVEQHQEEQHSGHIEEGHHIAEAPTYLEIPEQTNHDEHSPIEEALVINQQVRDDAADSMEPSPPVRLYYRDENRGVDKIFDIFASTGLESHEADLLFHDNRTLFYEPLSAFFAKLRETEHFSGEGWEDAEIAIRMDLEDSSLSINEDHKETENISLFRLSFIWSGLGLEEPLELTLVRRPERFTVQIARLIEQVEQRDFHTEDTTEPHETQRETETGANPEINTDGVGNDDSKVVLGDNNQEEARVLIEPDGAPADPPRGVHDSEVDEDAQVIGPVQPEVSDEQRQVVDDADTHGTVQEVEAKRSSEETVQDVSVYNKDPTPRAASTIHQGSEAEGTDPSPNDDENTVSNGQSPGTRMPKPQDDNYDEYEAEEVNDLTPAQTSIQNETSGTAWDANEYDYEEDYDGDEEHSKHTLPDNAPNEPTDSDHAHAPSAPKPQGHESHNASLKRNLDELEYEEYETPSAPSSPASDNKRVKHT